MTTLDPFDHPANGATAAEDFAPTTADVGSVETSPTTSPRNMDAARFLGNPKYGAEAVPVPKMSKHPTVKGWPTLQFSDEARAAWIEAGTDLGLRTRFFPTIDVDIDDPKLVAVVNSYLTTLAESQGAKLLIRTRPGSVRMSFTCRLDPFAEPFSKMRQKLKGGGAVEILADGQMVKLIGTHPGSGKLYELEGEDLPEAEELLALDELGARLLLAQLRVVLELAGAKPDGRAGASSSTSRPPRIAVSSVDKDYVTRLVALLPANAAKTFPDYDEYLQMGAAIWGASGGAEWGRDLWLGWVRTGDGADDASDEEVLDKWASFAGGTSLGLDYLESKVSEFGDDATKHTVARHQFKRLAGERPVSEALAAQGLASGTGVVAWATDSSGWARPWLLPERITTGADMVRRFIHCAEVQGYIDRTTGVVWTKANLNDGFTAALANDPALTVMVPGPKGTTKPKRLTPFDWLRDQPGVMRLDRRGYRVGEAEFINTAKGTVYNMWAPPKAVIQIEDIYTKEGRAGLDALGVTDADAEEFLLPLMRHLLDNAEPTLGRSGVTDRVLDWLARNLWNLTTKPAHHIVISSDVQGVGKSSLAELVGALVCGGQPPEGIVAVVDENMLAMQFNAWASARYIHIEELGTLLGHAHSAGEKRTKYKGLKPLFASPPTTIPINQKNQPVYQAKNVSFVLATTNMGELAIPIEHGDRRLVLIESPAKTPLPKGIATKLHAALADARSWTPGTGALWRLLVWFRMRWADVEADAARLGIVNGHAWDTRLKGDTLDASMGSVATDIKELLDAGRIGWLVTTRDVRQALIDHGPAQHRQRSVTPHTIAAALRELGARVCTGGNASGKVRLDGHAHPTRLFVLAGGDLAKQERALSASAETLAAWYAPGRSFGPVENEARDKETGG